MLDEERRISAGAKMVRIVIVVMKVFVSVNCLSSTSNDLRLYAAMPTSLARFSIIATQKRSWTAVDVRTLLVVVLVPVRLRALRLIF